MRINFLISQTDKSQAFFSLLCNQCTHPTVSIATPPSHLFLHIHVSFRNQQLIPITTRTPISLSKNPQPISILFIKTETQRKERRKTHLFFFDMEMTCSTKFGYQRLIPEAGCDYEHDDCEEEISEARRQVGIGKGTRSSWFRSKKMPSVRRVRVRVRVRVPSLGRFLRRKSRVMASSVRISIGKVVKRLKESQSHFGDLFAGNYLFLQVNPTSLKYCIEKSWNHHNLGSKYSVSRVAS
ncbi:uncharacterized protein LOC110808999 [Carica papaya]|uniref:uncharacterized protein LOC110808999 n=1 Tax=Carica papaya TaxID=3649 RepID=UPI000B8D1533|nr:uncharacterized protein LOC110808999 [Carica papaya]